VPDVVGRDFVEPTNQSPRIGCVKYLNARPLIRGWAGEVDFDHPSTLCRKLAAGKLDLALVSGFEFLRNPTYRIVDDISISSTGPVYSVVVAYRGDISEVDEIRLDPASETSVNLLRCLLAERGLNPRLVPKCEFEKPAQQVVPGSAGREPAVAGSLPANPNARLLIGDQAIRFRQGHVGEFHFWDLGEEWNKLVGLPFVYALWLIRPEVRDFKSVANRLRALRDENLTNLDQLIAEVVSPRMRGDPGHRKEFDPQFYARYYRGHLRFSFGEKEKEGLSEFYKRCVKLRLLPHDDLESGAWDLELARRCV
jgi:chorismate dehydratase